MDGFAFRDFGLVGVSWGSKVSSPHLYPHELSNTNPAIKELTSTTLKISLFSFRMIGEQWFSFISLKERSHLYIRWSQEVSVCLYIYGRIRLIRTTRSSISNTSSLRLWTVVSNLGDRSIGNDLLLSWHSKQIHHRKEVSHAEQWFLDQIADRDYPRNSDRPSSEQLLKSQHLRRPRGDSARILERSRTDRSHYTVRRNAAPGSRIGSQPTKTPLAGLPKRDSITTQLQSSPRADSDHTTKIPDPLDWTVVVISDHYVHL